MDKKKLADIAKKMGIQTHVSKSVKAAINKVISSEKIPFRIIICGSLYLVGSVLADINK